MTRKEAAEYLNVSVGRIGQLIKKNRIDINNKESLDYWKENKGRIVSPELTKFRKIYKGE